MVEEAQAEHHVEASPRGPVRRLKIGLEHAVTRRIDALDFQHERGLAHVCRTRVDAQGEVGTAL